MAKIILAITLIVLVTGIPIEFFAYRLSIKKRLIIIAFLLVALIVSIYFSLR